MLKSLREALTFSEKKINGKDRHLKNMAINGTGKNEEIELKL